MQSNKKGLADLKRLHQAAQQSHASAEQAARIARPKAATKASASTEAEDPAAFRRAMLAVTPLKQTGRREPAPAKAQSATQRGPTASGPASISLAIAMRRAAATGETSTRADAGVSDGGEVAHLLSESGTAFVRADAAPDTARNLRRGQWPAGAELDLHGLRVEQARHAVLSFLDECLEHSIRCVRIVHGKGYGSQGLEPVLKDKVRTWLVQKSEVMAFSQAPEREGGSGALLVLLRQTGVRNT